MTLFRCLGARTKWIALLATAFALCAAGTASADSIKPYKVVLTSGVDTSVGSVTAVLTNETTPQTLGSAKLTVPTGFKIATAQITQGPATAMATVSTDRTSVLLTGLALPTGGSVTVSITLASYPCSPTPAPWGVEVKQSNNFSGPPGNDMGPATPDSNNSTSLCSAPCPKNTTCTAALNNVPNTTFYAFNVAASSAKSTDTLKVAANPSGQTPLTCPLQGAPSNQYTSDDPNVYDFLTANTDRTKTVTLSFNAPDPTKVQEICFEAPVVFMAKTGINPVSFGNAQFEPANNEYIGILPDCPTKGPITSPCHNRTADTLAGSTMTLVAVIPSGFAGDPHIG